MTVPLPALSRRERARSLGGMQNASDRDGAKRQRHPRGRFGRCSHPSIIYAKHPEDDMNSTRHREPGRRHARNGADPLHRRPRNPLRLSPPRPRYRNAAGSAAALLGQHRCMGSRRRQRSRRRSPCDRIRQRRGRPLDRSNARQYRSDGDEMQSPSSICSAFPKSTCWAFLSAAASPSRSPPSTDGWSASSSSSAPRRKAERNTC